MLFVLLVACGTSSTPVPGAVEPAPTEPNPDGAAPVLDAGGDAATDAPTTTPKPTGQCAQTFGTALTPGFGRIDGIVYAVQKPSDTSCPLPNSDHVIVQVLMNGAVYRMVVNVQSDRAGADPKIRVGAKAHPLPAPAFAEGWHLDAPLDYVTTLDAHAGATFTPMTLEEAVDEVASELKIGDPVSVYAENGGQTGSAHLIHRNKANRDGAIVVTPTTTPRFLMFHFANQTF